MYITKTSNIRHNQIIVIRKTFEFSDSLILTQKQFLVLQAVLTMNIVTAYGKESRGCIDRYREDCGKTTASVLHDAQLLLNKQQQIWGGVYIH